MIYDKTLNILERTHEGYDPYQYPPNFDQAKKH